MGHFSLFFLQGQYKNLRSLIHKPVITIQAIILENFTLSVWATKIGTINAMKNTNIIYEDTQLYFGHSLAQTSQCLSVLEK
jgi:hypothetical protein